MRKLLIASMMSAGVIMQAQAANTDLYTPQMNAYVNFSFGAPKAQSLGLHYGLRMDYNENFKATISRSMSSSVSNALPPLLQMDFSANTGFTNAKLNGLTFMKRIVTLNQNGEEGAAGVEGSGGSAFSSFTTVDWGILAAGVVGVGFGVAQVAKNDETPDTTTTASSGGGGGGTLCAPGSVPGVGGQCLPIGGGAATPPLCAPGQIPGVGGQCLPLAAPSSAPIPSGGGAPSAPGGGGGLCAPGSVPGIGGQCAPSAPSGGGAPAAPGGGGAPSSPVSGQCLPGDPSGMLCAPYRTGNQYTELQTLDIERLVWLETENGHMGDLIPQQ